MKTMKLLLLIVFAGFVSYIDSESQVQRVPKRKCVRNMNNDTIYDYNANDLASLKPLNLSQFRGKQEPGKNATEIFNGLKYVRPGNGFIPNFRLMAKVEVNGKNEHPLFTFLKSVCPATRDGFGDLQELFYRPLKNWDIRWNFEKFLIDPWGQPYMRYDPSAEPLSFISQDVQAFSHIEL